MEPDDESEHFNQFSIDFGNHDSAENDDDDDDENEEYDDCSAFNVEYSEQSTANMGSLDNIEREWIIVDDSEED